jgi:hypothetical protein
MRWSVFLSIFDSYLNLLVDRRQVHDFSIYTRPGIALHPLQVAYDGTQLMLTFLSVAETDGRLQIWARFFDAEGRPLRAPDAPDGEAFVVNDGATGDQHSMSLVAMPDGGFMLAWQEEGSTGSGADLESNGIRAALYAPDGARQFANAACDRGPFQLNSVHVGGQTWPTLVVMPEGVILGAWTDHSESGLDPSGSAIQAVALPARTLLPVE